MSLDDKVTAYLFQRLSVAIQIGNSTTFLESFATDCPFFFYYYMTFFVAGRYAIIVVETVLKIIQR